MTDCDLCWKLHVYNAIIVSQITYGLHTFYISDQAQRRLTGWTDLKIKKNGLNFLQCSIPLKDLKYFDPRIGFYVEKSPRGRLLMSGNLHLTWKNLKDKFPPQTNLLLRSWGQFVGRLCIRKSKRKLSEQDVNTVIPVASHENPEPDHRLHKCQTHRCTSVARYAPLRVFFSFDEFVVKFVVCFDKKKRKEN